MEFRCSQCGHLGEPEEIRATDQGTEVVCSRCGHGERLEASSTGDSPADSQSSPLAWDTTYEHLVPDADPGPRCPKCIERVEPSDEHCPHCGLGLSDRELLDTEQASAIVTEPLQDFVREEADERWSAVLDESDPNAFEEYVEWMIRYGGDEEAIRRVRSYLVRHPDDEAALDALDALTESLRSRLAAARAQAESESESFQSDVSRFRRYVVGGLAIFWTLALAVAIYLVFG